METEAFLKKYTEHLNENQLKAVRTVDGPVLLLAVPGSGKTTVLVTRLGYMLYCNAIPAHNILTLTYTVAATQDMQRRYEKLFGEGSSAGLEFRTINGICYKMIQQYARLAGKSEDSIFRLITDEKESAKIISDILLDVMDEYPTESDIKAVKTLITYCKNMLLTDEEIEGLGNNEGIKLFDIYRKYNQYLRQNRLMDYDDQMIYAYRMLKSSEDLLKMYRNRYRYICVDEAQDTSKIQHLIIGMLAGKDGNLFMVGDEDQSIYGFRAAYPEALLDFEKDHPSAKVLVMDQNYRSNAKIVQAADLFIQHNKARHDKHMRSTKDAGSDINFVELKTRSNQYGYLLKVAVNCDRETAVLYRDNESAIPLIDLLDRNGIDYRIKSVDMAFFTNRVVKDVTNIMKFALDPYNTELFMRIYFKCQTFLKKAQAERMCRISEQQEIPVLAAAEYVDSINGMVKGKCRSLATHLRNMLKENPSKVIFRIETPLGYGEYLERNNIDDNKLFILRMLSFNENSIGGFLKRLDYLQDMLKTMKPDYNSKFILSTIHSSKGLEYDRVFLMDVCDGVFPGNIIRSSNSSTPQERKEFEEERRLFYVGMTRAKNDLNIFTFKSESSSFIKEMRMPVRRNVSVQGAVKPRATAKPKAVVKDKPYETVINKHLSVSDFDLIIGERVIQNVNGSGTVSDVIYDKNGKIKKFSVIYDSGDEKQYHFPAAFEGGMMLESGEEMPLQQKERPTALHTPANLPVKKPEKKKRPTGKDTYASWADRYPNHVVIKKEGAFWTTRGESAEVLNRVLGYKLGGKPGSYMTGSPAIEPIVHGLSSHEINYIVIDDGEIVDQADFE